MSLYCSECQRPLTEMRVCFNHPYASADHTPGTPEEPQCTVDDCVCGQCEEPEESLFVCSTQQLADFGMALQAPIDAPPSTETVVTSEDFLPTSSEKAGRAGFFKAMAFEADKRVKELELKQDTLEARCEAATEQVTVLGGALGLIQKRAKVWVEQHWAISAGDETMRMMLAIIADARLALK